MKKSLAQGRYTLSKLLGVGGMAEVYEATDAVLGAPRAIKLLRLGDSDLERLRTRLKREASIMARLNHPHVLKVVDIGQEDGQDYVVMELAAAGSLSDRLDAAGALPQDDVVRWTIQILSALQAAHDAGVVHRDVKPQNILLDARGNALLADFGIALVEDAVNRNTRTDTMIGSLVFMAPEQRLDARSVGPVADIYAVGCSMFMLLTGASPMDLFVADPESARWQLLPDPLKPVISVAVALRPEHRYKTARAMAEALAPLHPEGASLLRSFDAVQPVEGGGPRTTMPLAASTLAGLDDYEATLPESASILDAAAAQWRAPAPLEAPASRRPSLGWAALVGVGIVLLVWALATGGRAPVAELSAVEPEVVAQPTPAPSQSPVVVVAAAAPEAPAPEAPAVPPAPEAPRTSSTRAAPSSPSTPAPPAESPSVQTGALGQWSGTLGGFEFVMALSGDPERIRGTTETRSKRGTRAVATSVEGRYNPDTRRLSLADVAESPTDDLCGYTLTLSADERSLSGSCSRAGGGLVPLSLKRGP